jgi:hypothetical protein
MVAGASTLSEPFVSGPTVRYSAMVASHQTPTPVTRRLRDRLTCLRPVCGTAVGEALTDCAFKAALGQVDVPWRRLGAGSAMECIRARSVITASAISLIPNTVGRLFSIATRLVVEHSITSRAQPSIGSSRTKQSTGLNAERRAVLLDVE